MNKSYTMNLSSVSLDNLERKTRSYLRKLARGRVSGTVTADDVHRFLRNNNIRLSQNEQISLTRKVLSEPTFYPDGRVPSRRPEARGREITEWVLV